MEFSWTFQDFVLGFTLKKNQIYSVAKRNSLHLSQTKLLKALQKKQQQQQPGKQTNKQPRKDPKKGFVDFRKQTNLYKFPQMP